MLGLPFVNEDAKVAERISISPARIAELDVKADEVTVKLTSLPLADPAFDEQLSAIRYFGDDAIRNAAESISRSEQRANASDPSATGEVLTQLHREIELLDPARRGDLLLPRKLFGLIPLGNPLEDYFDEYRSAQRSLGQVLQALYRNQDQLRKDNAVLKREQSKLSTAMTRIGEYLYVGEAMDRRLEDASYRLDVEEPERAARIRDQFIFPLRQKRQDLATQRLVAQQAWMALHAVQANNTELINGIDRAADTTIAALKTAILVADSLTRQQLTMEQIQSSLSQANRSLAGVGEELHAVRRDAASGQADAAREMERLKDAFGDLHRVMEQLDHGIKTARSP